MGVGTSTGHILLYDIRSSRPLLIKDHFYGIPIKKLLFHSTLDQVISLDAKSVKVSRIRFYMNYVQYCRFKHRKEYNFIEESAVFKECAELGLANYLCRTSPILKV